MIDALRPWIADALVIVGLLVITIGVIGLVRLPNLYARIHAGSSTVFLGVISVLLAGLVTGNPAIISRVILISVVLAITGPVSAHAVGRAAFLHGKQLARSDSTDESDRLPVEAKSDQR